MSFLKINNVFYQVSNEYAHIQDHLDAILVTASLFGLKIFYCTPQNDFNEIKVTIKFSKDDERRSKQLSFYFSILDNDLRRVKATDGWTEVISQQDSFFETKSGVDFTKPIQALQIELISDLEENS